MLVQFSYIWVAFALVFLVCSIVDTKYFQLLFKEMNKRNIKNFFQPTAKRGKPETPISIDDEGGAQLLD